MPRSERNPVPLAGGDRAPEDAQLDGEHRDHTAPGRSAEVLRFDVLRGTKNPRLTVVRDGGCYTLWLVSGDQAYRRLGCFYDRHAAVAFEAILERERGEAPS